MSGQLGLSCAWLPESYHDQGNLGTPQNGLNMRSSFAYGINSAAPVQQKLTSADLRSPVMPSISATSILSDSVHSSQDRIGEMPKPTAQAYEKRSLHTAYSFYSTHAPTVLGASYELSEVDSILSARRAMSYQLQPTTRSLSVQEQWSNLWQSGRGTYHEPALNNGLSRPATHTPLKLGAQKSTGTSYPSAAGSDLMSTRRTWSQITGASVASKSTKKWELQRVVHPPQRDLPMIKQRSMDHIEETSTDGGDSEAPPPPKPNNASKLLSDSLAFCILAVNNPPARSSTFAVIRISNIPWTISVQEVEKLFSYVKLPDQKEYGQCIHIPINKSTGKTQSEAYIELATDQDVYMAIRQFPHVPVKGRKLFISKSSQEKLFQKIFPQWKGKFMSGRPFFLNEHGKAVDITAMTPPPLVERQEFESILAICRNYKLHFSRKCGERPFESLISIIVKFPWDKPNIITTMQRDHLYEYYKLAIGVLHNHLSKTTCTLNKNLMERMLRAALKCPGFTVPQKKGILTASGQECPHELVQYIEPPEDSPETSDGDETEEIAFSRLNIQL